MFRKSKSRPNPALESAIVTSDSVKRKAKLNPASWVPKAKLPSVPVLAGVGVLALVIALPALFFLYLWLGDASRHAVSSTVCKDSLIKDASNKIQANDRIAMARVSKNIVSLKNYQKDPNCEFILVRSAILREDMPEAKKQLPALRAVYQNEYSYSKAFTTRTYTPDELQTLIDGISESQTAASDSLKSNQADISAQDSEADKLAPGAQQ